MPYLYILVQSNDHIGDVMVQLNDYILNHIAKTPLILSRYNKEKKRFDYDILKNKVDKYIENGKRELILLYGLRGLGKTTLLSQIYHYARLKIEPNRVLYFSMDELKLNDINLMDALKAYSEIFGINLYEEKIILLLDEVQYEKHWDLVLKNLYDTTNIFIIATGSSALKLRESPDLARRALHKPIYPMTFREYLYLTKNIKIESLFEEVILNNNLDNFKKVYAKVYSLILEEDVKKYLRVGSLPFALEDDELDVYDKIYTMLERIIYKDVREVRDFNMETLDKAFKLLYLLANPKGERYSYESLANTLEIAKGTLINLVDVLEKCELLFKIYPYGSIEKKVRKSQKIKFLPVPIKTALWHKMGVVIDDVCYGSLLEDVVAFYLYLFCKKKGYNLSYEPKKGGADFILISPYMEKIVIEVGLGKKSSKQVLRSMERVKAYRGIVIGDELKVEDNILHIPWKGFLLLI